MNYMWIKTEYEFNFISKYGFEQYNACEVYFLTETLSGFTLHVFAH